MVGLGASCLVSRTQLLAPMTANTREQKSGCGNDVCGPAYPGGQDVMRLESKLGMEFVKAVYCHSAYLTYRQSTSSKCRAR